ncbi:hypothetical protein GWI33_005598 [Rhynchophorus ferrugineus]|uniref:Uncharacterized protein n=1 Tax=Rhynchophorus ferrugineus TaxID=354439 RepID=A0A834IH45_RHYFE|nr:hypothetical protein GWI33_005598 [Rhynchophorus ferrugineus]
MRCEQIAARSLIALRRSERFVCVLTVADVETQMKKPKENGEKGTADENLTGPFRRKTDAALLKAIVVRRTGRDFAYTTRKYKRQILTLTHTTPPPSPSA